MSVTETRIPAVVKKFEKSLLEEWLGELRASRATDKRLTETEVREQATKFLDLLQQALAQGKIGDFSDASWDEVRHFLEELSKERVLQGFDSSETATFIMSFKRPFFTRLGQELSGDAVAFGREVWTATAMMDALSLWTVRAFQRTREEVIHRQQQELLELSTPVVKLWDGVLALPIIGTLDSARTQVVMESLLQRIVDTGSEIAIIDITGVPTVDTLVAQHLLKTVTAIRLMGADCIISGIRPQIAQTIVHLGVDLQSVTTKGSLADALSLALKRTGCSIIKAKG